MYPVFHECVRTMYKARIAYRFYRSILIRICCGRFKKLRQRSYFGREEASKANASCSTCAFVPCFYLGHFFVDFGVYYGRAYQAAGRVIYGRLLWVGRKFVEVDVSF